MTDEDDSKRLKRFVLTFQQLAIEHDFDFEIVKSSANKINAVIEYKGATLPIEFAFEHRHGEREPTLMFTYHWAKSYALIFKELDRFFEKTFDELDASPFIMFFISGLLDRIKRDNKIKSVIEFKEKAKIWHAFDKTGVKPAIIQVDMSEYRQKTDANSFKAYIMKKIKLDYPFRIGGYNKTTGDVLILPI